MMGLEAKGLGLEVGDCKQLGVGQGLAFRILVFRITPFNLMLNLTKTLSRCGPLSGNPTPKP